MIINFYISAKVYFKMACVCVRIWVYPPFPTTQEKQFTERSDISSKSVKLQKRCGPMQKGQVKKSCET